MDHNLWTHYRLRLVDYRAILIKQDGKCPLCLGMLSEGHPARLIPGGVDHDHKTGIVRGILCRNCNFGLGYIEKMGDGGLDRVLKYLTNS